MFEAIGHTFLLMVKRNATQFDASTITPRNIVDAFKNHPGLIRSESILNRFLGFEIRASGHIVGEDEVGFGLDYVTVTIDDEGVLVFCNFEKPVAQEVGSLKKGERINVHGVVSNANRDTVVLTSCRLES